MRPLDIAILILLSILWGGSFFFIEVLVDYWPPLTIVTIRVAIAAVILWMILLARRIPIPKTAGAWWALLVVGMLNNALPFTLIVWGQTQISSGMASILNATTPFFTVLVAGAILADERITRGKLLGVIIGLIGTVVMIGPEILVSGLSSGGALGQLAVMGAALSYAFAAVWSRRFKAQGISPMVIATGQTSMAALMLLPLTLMIDQPLQNAGLYLGADMMVWGAMLGLAIASTVLAYILYFRLIASAGATNAALVTFLIPISAILLGVFILGEAFTRPQAIGMALIGLGLLIMDGRLFKRTRPEQ
ncbi:MAG: EamA family transporter [Hellea sp.]|nr:EamA family transporter [Hellea sp.]